VDFAEFSARDEDSTLKQGTCIAQR
jgi:hypothetical protein